jgi:hypothetical protein
MRARHTRLLLATATAVVAVAGITIATSVSFSQTEQERTSAPNPHADISDGPPPLANQFEHETVARGTTPTGVHYTVTIGLHETGDYRCFEVVHGDTAAGGCGLPLTNAKSVSVAPSFGDDMVIVALVPANAARVQVSRTDGRGSVASADAVSSKGYRVAHLSMRVPQSTWPNPEGHPPEGTTSPAPVPPAVRVTTLDSEGDVLDQEQTGGPSE